MIDLDWFETEINGKRVRILSFDIDYDLYLLKKDNYKIFKCNKRSNELTLEFENEDLNELLRIIEDHCKTSGVKSFWSPDEMWKNYKLSQKQKGLAKIWNMTFNNTLEFHQYMSKYIAYKVLHEII